jgi:D-sedoheptulose 7-phosphate isomerase
MNESGIQLPDQAEEKIKQHFLNSMAVKQQVIETCVPDILAAATCIAEALNQQGKLLLCGNGGSAADSQHLAAEFVSVLTQDFLRPGLPAIALTTDSSILTASANDFGFDGIFERQVQALGKAGDVMLGISTSGNSKNVIRALEYARKSDMRTIAFTGSGGGKMAEVAEISVRIPSTVTQYIQESHIAVAHIVCHLVERALFVEVK